jgi:DNA-binding PadR family transcriptional regulator
LVESELSAEENILMVLAQEKSRTHYELWKQDKVARSNKTVLEKLSLLEKKGLIRSSQEKVGRKRKSYELTMIGLIVTLRYERAFKYIDKIAKTHEMMLPLVFGKWSFFKEKGILNEVIERLQSSVVQYWSESYTLTYTARSLRELFLIQKGILDLKTPRLSPKRSELSGTDINHLFLGLDRLTSLYSSTQEREKIENYLRVLREDDDLKSEVDGFIDYYDVSFAQVKENFESWKSWWKSL